MQSTICEQSFAIRNSPFSAASPFLHLGSLHTESTKISLGSVISTHKGTAIGDLAACWTLGVPIRTYPFVFIRAEESGVVPFLHHYKCDARLIILLQFNASLPDSQEFVVENLSHTEREVWSTRTVAMIQITLICLQISFTYPQIIYHVPSCTVTQE